MKKDWMAVALDIFEAQKQAHTMQRNAKKTYISVRRKIVKEILFPHGFVAKTPSIFVCVKNNLSFCIQFEGDKFGVNYYVELGWQHKDAVFYTPYPRLGSYFKVCVDNYIHRQRLSSNSMPKAEIPRDWFYYDNDAVVMADKLRGQLNLALVVFDKMVSRYDILESSLAVYTPSYLSDCINKYGNYVQERIIYEMAFISAKIGNDKLMKEYINLGLSCIDQYPSDKKECNDRRREWMKFPASLL